jgi:hypothetical protein
MDFGRLRKWGLVLGLVAVFTLVGMVKHILHYAGVLR